MVKISPAFAHIAYRVLHFGEPSLPRPELLETVAPHADCLRYDVGFHHPEHPDLIVLPVFRHRQNGRTSNLITHGKWHSYHLKLTQTTEPLGPLENWVTYQGAAEKVPVTFSEYVQQRQYTVVGWR